MSVWMLAAHCHACTPQVCPGRVGQASPLHARVLISVIHGISRPATSLHLLGSCSETAACALLLVGQVYSCDAVSPSFLGKPGCGTAAGLSSSASHVVGGMHLSPRAPCIGFHLQVQPMPVWQPPSSPPTPVGHTNAAVMTAPEQQRRGVPTSFQCSIPESCRQGDGGKHCLGQKHCYALRCLLGD